MTERLPQPSITGAQSSIARPSVQAYNFEIKPNMIQIVHNNVQFDGLQDEDLNMHIANFLEVWDTFKINRVSDDAIKFHLSPFSLRGKATSWLKSLPLGSITSWYSLAEKLLGRYFPHGCTAKLQNEILSFNKLIERVYTRLWRDKKSCSESAHIMVWIWVSRFNCSIME